MNIIELLRDSDPNLRLPGKPIRALGIDLGTTNSTVAQAAWSPADNKPPSAWCIDVQQPTLEGTVTGVLMPSVVVDKEGDIVVGEGAKRLRARAVEFDLVRNVNMFYDCKNDIGTRRTYYRAQPGFTSASEIAGKVLGTLRDAAARFDNSTASRIVVTVPASFQVAQRQDTLKAAELAGIKLSGGDLLDEPVAAFLDYLMSSSDDLLTALNRPTNLLVFDFGGGTCDVAIFRLGRVEGGILGVAPLAVSRYHRLGGGDIDAAVVYDVLLPQLMAQNRTQRFELSFSDKKNFVEPALLSIAEALKVNICREVTRRKGLGIYRDVDKSEVFVTLPGTHECALKDRELTLRSPQLTARQFEELLEPFLNRDLLYAHETEYRLTNSMFAPIRDALDRCQLEPGNIDLCLMVGGSSLIPQVLEAMAGYLGHARLLTFPDENAVQTAVARGAAWHSLALAVSGHGLIQPVSPESIGIVHESGVFELVPRGSPLPFPAAGYAHCDRLEVPATSTDKPLMMRVEIAAGSDRRPLASYPWELGPVNRGDKLKLEYRFDENQLFDFRLSVVEANWVVPLARSLENPLTNVVNPNRTRLEIDELEEDLRSGRYGAAARPGKLAELARKYSSLGQREKAFDLLRQALQIQGGSDPGLMNLMANCAAEMGDAENAERLYREAAGISAFPYPWFNLSLHQERQGKLDAAIDSVERAIASSREAPYLVQRASLAARKHDPEGQRRFIEEAFALFGQPASLNDWELVWYQHAAALANDKSRLEAASSVRASRQDSGVPQESPEGQLPKLGPEGHSR